MTDLQRMTLPMVIPVSDMDAPASLEVMVSGSKPWPKWEEEYGAAGVHSVQLWVTG